MAFNKNLSQIVYEDINGEYGWGKYGEFKVLIRKKDGYINATKLCKAGGKELFNYMANKSSQILVNEVASVLGISRTDLTQELNGGSIALITGTYVHQDMVPHIASWVSPQFAIKVSKIVNNFIVREYEEQIRAKDGTIDELSKRILRQSEQLDRQSAQLDKQSNEIQLLLAGSNRLERHLDVANENIVCTLQTLGRVSDRAVPLNRLESAKNEWLVVLHLEDAALTMPYFVVRAQEVSAQRLVGQKRREFPNMREVVQFKNHPNVIELWNAVKKRLGGRLVRPAHSRSFCLNGISEETFVRVVHECDTEKREHYNDVLRQIEEEDEKADVEETKEEPVVTAEKLLRMTMPELKALCRQNQWKGWSKLKKVELVEFILASLE